MARTLQEIKDAAAAARGRAEKVLTAEQSEMADALADEQDAKEAEAAEQAKFRAIIMAERVDAARVAAGGAYLVQGVDLVALFPLGSAPSAESLPGGGVIVIRSPDMETSDAFAANAEAMKKGLSALAVGLVCGCVVDPDRTSPEGTRLLNFLQKYPEAAGTIAGRAKKLGGAQADATKRGRA